MTDDLDTCRYVCSPETINSRGEFRTCAAPASDWYLTPMSPDRPVTSRCPAHRVDVGSFGVVGITREEAAVTEVLRS